MSDYKHIILEKSVGDGIAKLTLNRPERRNALNDVMQDEIGDAIDEVDADDSIRVLILTGSGRVFCADTQLDGPGGVAVRGDRIVAAGPEVGGTAVRTLDYPDGLLLPGLVDMHAHPARGGSRHW